MPELNEVVTKEIGIEVVRIDAELISPQSGEAGLNLIERMARTCYNSKAADTAEKRDQFIAGLVKRGHESVIEHVTASFMLTIPRSISHQIVRHRIGVAYSQESQRYCNYTKQPLRVVAPVPGLEEPAMRRWEESCKATALIYEALINGGAKPEQARSVLPECTATRLGMTANLRAWRHILRERWLNQHADPAIREVMGIVAAHLRRLFPPVFGDLSDGTGQGESPESANR